MYNLIIAVEKARISEIEDVINAALWRYWELHPGREIAAICLDAGDDRDEQIRYLIGRLQELIGKPDDELNQWPILIPRDMMGSNDACAAEEIPDGRRILSFNPRDDVRYSVKSGRIVFGEKDNG